MSETTCHQRNRDAILSGAKDYYKNHKKGLRDQERDKLRNLSEEKNIKKERIWRKQI